MASDQPTRAQHWREFMEEVLGVPGDTPLSDVLPSVIMKAAKPHYASILTEAAAKACSLALATKPQPTQPSSMAPQTRRAPFDQSPAYLRGYPPYSRAKPELLRASIDKAIVQMRLPPRLIERVRFTGDQGTTNSGNFRMDFTDWAFGATGSPGPLPHTGINMLEALFYGVPGLGAQGVQIMKHTTPFLVRITFRSEQMGRLFERALYVKTNDTSKHWRDAEPTVSNTIAHKTSSSTDQYPPRTSYQEATAALIDSYRPSGSAQVDSGIDSYRPTASFHKADSQQSLEKHPADSLREHRPRGGGRENGRLSPICELNVAIKRERDNSPTSTALRSQAKRPRATDFIDSSEDHYP